MNLNILTKIGIICTKNMQLFRKMSYPAIYALIGEI